MMDNCLISRKKEGEKKKKKKMKQKKKEEKGEGGVSFRQIVTGHCSLDSSSLK